jgi:hypothetical protein
MISYAQPKMDELRRNYVETIRREVEESTIERLQQQLDADIAGMFMIDTSDIFTYESIFPMGTIQ